MSETGEITQPETQGNNPKLVKRLKKSREWLLDADDTLVFCDPSYYQRIVRTALADLNIEIPQSTLDTITTAADIDKLRVALNLEKERFWPAFNRYSTEEERLKATRVFPDVAALTGLPRDVSLSIITHAPSNLALEYASLIKKATGLEVPHVQSIYHYGDPEKGDPQKMSKPNPLLVYDMLTELHIIDPYHPRRRANITKGVAIIGDSPVDISLAHNTKSIPVWINRGNSQIPSPPYLEFNNFTDLVKVMNSK